MDAKVFWKQVREINDDRLFSKYAMELFHYQKQSVKTYRKFIDLLPLDKIDPQSIHQIPFLPVEAFRNHIITDSDTTPTLVFASSGTSGNEVSCHFLADEELYRNSFSTCFRLFYGDPEKYCILALLPSYLERSGSSLVYMADELIKQSGNPHSGFYLHNTVELINKLKEIVDSGDKIFLLGVTFALLDLFEQHNIKIPDAVIMETGGMKGRRKELTREELHNKLKVLTGASKIHSEYGMTELLSQAYSLGDGIFNCPPWMKVVVHDLHDPFEVLPPGATGTISIIDLANIHSCGFIATRDLGRCHENGSFEVLGRVDNSELRGCNLMIA